jgi:methylmalonyl-CoA/ethylmalonyl-CoA epimerase
MPLQRIDHIGVIVEDMDQARAFVSGVLGLELARERDLGELKTAFFRCGDCEIELIEPRTDEGRRQRLGEGNRARIEHIAIEVDKLQQTLDDLGTHGVRPGDGPRVIGPNLNVWTDAETSGGVIYQLVEKNVAPE